MSSPRDLLLWLLFLLACTPDPESVSTPEAASNPNALFVRAEPLLHPGVDPTLVLELEGNLLLPSAQKGTLLFGGGVALIHGQAREVRIVNEAGNMIARHDEYVSPAGLGRHGEELLTWDSYFLRVSRLDLEGRIVGEVEVREAVAGLREGLGVPLGLDGNELVLAFLSPAERESPGEPTQLRLVANFAFVDLADGRLLRALTLPGQEQWSVRLGDAWTGIPVIFGRRVVAAAAYGGAWIADTDSLVFRMHRADGVARQVSFEHEPVPARPEWVEQVRDSIREWVEDPDGPPRFAALRRTLFEAGVPARSTLPAFSDLLGGADGRLWIREFPLPGQDTVLWVGLDETLRPAVRMEVPIELEVLDIDHDRVLVRSRASERIVQVHPLVGRR